MVVDNAGPPRELLDTFVEIAHRIVWCTVATTDRRGRPRSRVLHPYWERTEAGITGWVVTRPSPLKVAHLARSPYVSCTYWDASHDVAIADCHTAWEDDPAERARVWELYAAAPTPLGFDFHAIWPDGPSTTGSAALRLEPWRLHTANAETIATPKVWRRAGPTDAPLSTG